MAQVIKGVFPATKKSAGKKKNKAVPSYVLHVAIAFSEPLIWRRLQVPGEYTLSQLHHVIQRSMGWSDSHLHQFLIGKISYEPTRNSAGPRESKRFDEQNYRLSSLEESMRFMFTYFYDAGQGWEHQITLEEVVAPLDQPVLMAGARACPPETVDDIHAYQELLAAVPQPESTARQILEELAGPTFDPGFFDLEAARDKLASLQ